MDLDGFKQVNDTLGHDEGDRVLAETAQRMRTAMGPDVVLARLGGDEFAALLTRGQPATTTWTPLAQLREATPAQATFSAGVAAGPTTGPRPCPS